MNELTHKHYETLGQQTPRGVHYKTEKTNSFYIRIQKIGKLMVPLYNGGNLGVWGKEGIEEEGGNDAENPQHPNVGNTGTGTGMTSTALTPYGDSDINWADGTTTVEP